MDLGARSIVAEPVASLQSLADQEYQLRTATLAEPPDPAAVLDRWVRALELNLVVAALHEAVHEVGAKTVPAAVAELDRIVALASSIARLDLAQVISENAASIPKPGFNHAEQAASVDLALVVRSVRPVLAFCPIEELERAACSLGQRLMGHRCRLAYDGLDAFVRRNSPLRDKAAAVAGRAFADGRLSFEDVCDVLDLAPPDAAAYLEEHGYCRHPSVIELAPASRDEILARIRRDRLAGTERPDSRDVATRVVIASQRIEGVDARPWIRST